MIDSSSESDEAASNKRVGADVAGSAYRESITSVDGFTRGPNGRVKFNKDTKKRRRENEEIEDVEMGDAELASGKNKKHKRKPDQKLGHEFKAKVSHRNHCYEIIAEHLSLYRKPGVTSKKVVWIRTPTCPCPKLQRKEVAETRWALRAKDDDRIIYSSVLECIFVNITFRCVCANQRTVIVPQSICSCPCRWST